MSDRIQQIVGIIFALAFIALLAMINGSVLNFGQSVNGQLNRTNASSEAYELQAFDNTKVTGATVISTINNYDTLCNYALTISVKTGSTTTVYGVGGSARYTATPGNSAYINPAKSFTSKLERNTNGVLNKIIFEQAP